MIIFVAIVLTIITIVFIAYPLFISHTTGIVKGSSGLYSDQDSKESVLKDIKFDYDSGIIGQEDYNELESRLKTETTSMLKKTSNKEKVEDLDEEIERQVRELHKKQIRFCPQCGEKSLPGERFCVSCGAKLGGSRRSG